MQRTYSTLKANRLAAWKQRRGLTMREPALSSALVGAP